MEQVMKWKSSQNISTYLSLVAPKVTLVTAMPKRNPFFSDTWLAHLPVSQLNHDSINIHL